MYLWNILCTNDEMGQEIIKTLYVIFNFSLNNLKEAPH